MPRCIAIVAVASLRLFMLALARRLKSSGASVRIYVSTDQEVAYYRRTAEPGLLDAVVNSEKCFREVPDKQNIPSSLFEIAQGWEQKIGCTFNRLIMSNRHFGRGYALAGSGHARSRFSELFDHADVTWAYVQGCEFWDREFSQHGIDLIINSGLLPSALAHVYGARVRQLCGSRTKNLHYWAYDEHFATAEFSKRFEKLSPDDIVVAPEDPYFQEQTHQKSFRKNDSLLRLFYNVMKFSGTRVYHHMRGYEKAKGYYASEIIREMIRTWFHTRKMTGQMAVDLQFLKGKHYVFFPLQTEPEASLSQVSPEFFFQHAAIAAIARDLPAGWLVAVKETIHGVGRRPPGFYEQIASLKNVVWVDMFERGIDVVRHSRAVATITGTAGLEAAVIGIPVITFGSHNFYNSIPHVYYADIRDIRGVISKISDPSFDRNRSRLDGERFLKSISDCSFDMGRYNYVNEADFDEKDVDIAFAELIKTLIPASSLA